MVVVTPPAHRRCDELKFRFNLFRLTVLNPGHNGGRGRMQKLWIRLGREVDGQDLLEYTFLLAVILLASVALMMNVASGSGTIWTQTTATLNKADGGSTTAGSRGTDGKPPDATKESGS